MTVRRLEKSDAPLLIELRQRALHNTPTAFGSSPEDDRQRGLGFYEGVLARTDSQNVIFGAFDGDVLVGMVGILQDGRAKTGHRAYIWGMHVDAHVRGRGFGAELLDFAVAFAESQMKANYVALSVESSNQTARALYDSRGFQAWGTEPRALFVDGRYFDETHMWLDLQSRNPQ